MVKVKKTIINAEVVDEIIPVLNHEHGIDMIDNICKAKYQDIEDKIDPLELKKPRYELP